MTTPNQTTPSRAAKLAEQINARIGLQFDGKPFHTHELTALLEAALAEERKEGEAIAKELVDKANVMLEEGAASMRAARERELALEGNLSTVKQERDEAVKAKQLAQSCANEYWAKAVIDYQAQVARLTAERDQARAERDRMCVRVERGEHSDNCPFCLAKTQSPGVPNPMCHLCDLESERASIRDELERMTKERDAAVISHTAIVRATQHIYSPTTGNVSKINGVIL